MSVNNEIQNEEGQPQLKKMLPQNGVYASLFDKINLTPVAEIGGLNGFEDNTVMAETSADERVTAAVQVFMQCLQSPVRRSRSSIRHYSTTISLNWISRSAASLMKSCTMTRSRKWSPCGVAFSPW